MATTRTRQDSDPLVQIETTRRQIFGAIAALRSLSVHIPPPLPVPRLPRLISKHDVLSAMPRGKSPCCPRFAADRFCLSKNSRRKRPQGYSQGSLSQRSLTGEG